MNDWIDLLKQRFDDYETPSDLWDWEDDDFDDLWDDFDDDVFEEEIELPEDAFDDAEQPTEYEEDSEYTEEYPNTMDDHSVWDNAQSEVAQELVGSMIDDMLVRSANSMKGCESIPGELAQIIADLNKPLAPVFDWKRAFRRFLGNSYSENVKRSHRKQSRRFKDAMGAQHTKRSSVLVAIDTSGSVSDQELREFVSELTYMYKTGTRIHVLECDTDIAREYDYKPGCIDGVTGRGGTDFHPVVDYYKKHYKMYETLIYLTDGGASLDLDVPANNMLWVISSKGLHQDYPGKVLYIPKQEQ